MAAAGQIVRIYGPEPRLRYRRMRALPALLALLVSTLLLPRDGRRIRLAGQAVLFAASDSRLVR